MSSEEPRKMSGLDLIAWAASKAIAQLDRHEAVELDRLRAACLAELHARYRQSYDQARSLIARGVEPQLLAAMAEGIYDAMADVDPRPVAEDEWLPRILQTENRT